MNVSNKPNEAGAEPVLDTAGADQDMRAARRKRRRRRTLLMLSVPVALALGGGYFWLTGGRYVSTDNAYVHQPVIAVSADVAGRIVSVSAAANQPVTSGSEVFRIDQEPYRIALEQADAGLAAARLSVQQLRASYDTARAALAAAEAIRDVHSRELERQKTLADQGLSSSTALDNVTIAARKAENDVALARQAVTAAAAALGGDPQLETDTFPAVRAALARREAAARDLENTVVRAPASGIFSQTDGLNVGRYVTPGQMVASVVQDGNTWVEANFKETQLETLQVGQPVEVDVDAYSSHVFAGTVESMGAATGSEFALIPAQNATGNWVKVVQRLPVRIHVDTDPKYPLRDGMSVQIAVDTGKSRLDALR